MLTLLYLEIRAWRFREVIALCGVTQQDGSGARPRPGQLSTLCPQGSETTSAFHADGVTADPLSATAVYRTSTVEHILQDRW